nr:HipA family kinase [uncultured Capnocytophaga sp.]
MKRVKSIQPIIKRYDTRGSRPIQIMGDDLNQWVCKYGNNQKLFNELLAYEFAKLWNIKIPESALIMIDYDKHVQTFSDKRGLERRFFERECFGSCFLEETLDVNKSMFGNKGIVQRIKNKDDLLKISLFDIWLSNEDRNRGNYNLLLKTIEGGRGYTLFYIIDNTEIFNSSIAYTQGLADITEQDTVLSSELAVLLFKKDTQIVKKVDTLLSLFPSFIESCKKELSNIYQQIPQSWNINISQYEPNINELFSKNWLNICERNFRTYIQTQIII